ncbi:hypothetical protein CVD25_07945 [Bacillus canaveralius]|uniref:Uncharacterized protein n=1 Tax=Bacillus canaveralius TaxID=1403243 RepID=A0A2N5GIR3_9BACI|nr:MULTISPECIES: hypothetical protein [Bacillus]PLR80831.1 hypothetical protein CU635_17435 [Bacillus canaveralius]PLR81939.1 hypothetical protein CVD23_17700 [Bacillus sp. V33-4]PLR98293.1 hypothetical protein CVD25_07945 [Bacillus canaveralius]RSK51640.1 hypothetical protein EJA13_14095 [Bacillus canaveralius]
MHKFFVLVGIVFLLTGCGGEAGEKPEPSRPVEPEQGENPTATNTKGEAEPLTLNELESRITVNMNYDTYAAEIQSWAEQGQASIKETVQLPEDKEGSTADIIQVADGFMGVANNGQKITDVKIFMSVDEAIDYFEGQ